MTNDQACVVEGLMSCLVIGHSDLELVADVWITVVRCGISDRPMNSTEIEPAFCRSQARQSVDK